MSRTRVIAFANNKGGSGKTTSCSNIGCALSMMGKRVLIIDGDMQLNLTLSFFDEEKSLEYASNGKNIYTAIKEEKDIILKHFIDSLLICKQIPQGAKLLDVGCGPGFPSLPIAINRSDVTVTCIDSTAKKINYVNETAKKLGLTNITAISARAEVMANEEAETGSGSDIESGSDTQISVVQNENNNKRKF